MSINTHNLIVQFGKHKGQRWTRIPVGYLKWLINEGTQYSEIAQAELDRRGTTIDIEIEISGHAIDKASIRCRRNWHNTKKSKDEGLHSWLHRISMEALASVEGQKEKIEYKKMKFVFKFGEIYPTLLTIIPTEKKRTYASDKN